MNWLLVRNANGFSLARCQLKGDKYKYKFKYKYEAAGEKCEWIFSWTVPPLKGDILTENILTGVQCPFFLPRIRATPDTLLHLVLFYGTI